MEIACALPLSSSVDYPILNRANKILLFSPMALWWIVLPLFLIPPRVPVLFTLSFSYGLLLAPHTAIVTFRSPLCGHPWFRLEAGYLGVSLFSLFR